MAAKLSFVFLALTAVVYVNAAAIGDPFVTIYAEPIPVQEYETELTRGKREAEPLGLKGHLHHHHHYNSGGNEEYYSKPTSCYKCGGGGEGPTATFAQSSAGTISGGGGHGGHGGFGGQSVSQSAAYNFGPISASFSSSQSNGGGGGFFGF